MPFRGYFKFGDPRGPLFASKGARWPTVPAWRYRLGSKTATGSWSFLRTTGLLFEVTQPGHDICTWRAIADAPPCFTECRLTRSWVPYVNVVHWYLYINCGCPGAPWDVGIFMTPGHAANKNVLLGDFRTPLDPGDGKAGVVRLYQVQFDEENPPEGWPPWA